MWQARRVLQCLLKVARLAALPFKKRTCFAYYCIDIHQNKYLSLFEDNVFLNLLKENLLVRPMLPQWRALYAYTGAQAFLICYNFKTVNKLIRKLVGWFSTGHLKRTYSGVPAASHSEPEPGELDMDQSQSDSNPIMRFKFYKVYTYT